MISFTLNGEKKEYKTKTDKLSVSKLVEIRDLKGFFAVELNLKIVNKEDDYSFKRIGTVW